MSSEDYVSVKYATEDDLMDALGMSKTEQADVAQHIRDRFAMWITEGNNNVEGEVSKESDETSLTPGSDAAIFAKNAVINWGIYKQRQLLGSSNKADALNDYNTTIANLHKVLIKTRTTRTKTASIRGESQKNSRITLPSQIDTQMY